MSPSSRSGFESFAAANNEFAVNLYHELRVTEGNLFFSPYNIRSALMLAYAGARGKTAAQMEETLRLPGMNAGAAISLGAKAGDLAEGISLAEKAVDTGGASEKLEDLVKATGGRP